MNEEYTPRRIAIACQGGGSHAAFSAGVLKELLNEGGVGRHEIVALSGTSGGAICSKSNQFSKVPNRFRDFGES